MTTTAQILADAFGRIQEGVSDVLDGVGERALVWRADPRANTIAWLIWHLTRVQDDHLAGAFAVNQLWHEEGWMERFGLPFEPGATGYGHTADEVAAVKVGATLLSGYHEAVSERTVSLVGSLSDGDLDRIVDERWDPPVTLGVRLVSVISDDLQHVGQAALIRGLADRAGVR